MGKITEQYLSAIQQWTDGTGQPVSDIHTYMWMMVGGQGPASRQEEPSIESRRVPFTLEQTRTFLESTLRRTGFTETFLVVAFIRAIEDRFRVDSALYDKEQVAREQEPQRMRELVSDPEFLKDFQAMINKSNEKARQQGQTIPEIEISTDNLLPIRSIDFYYLEALKTALQQYHGERMCQCSPSTNVG